MDEDDICRNYHGGNAESFEAHASTERNKARHWRLIMAHVSASERLGATCDEIEVALELAHQTASARLSELQRQKAIERKLDLHGRRMRRLTRRGCNASVYVLPEYNKFQCQFEFEETNQ